MTPCVILAGGLGTRMRTVTGDHLPKILVPVRGEPFAHHQLTWLAGQGVTSVVLAIGHGGAAVQDYVGDGSRWGLTVAFVDEGAQLRGTGGALQLALQQGALPPEFMVVYGDSYLPLDLDAVATAYEGSGLPALMTVFRNEDRWERSNARYEDGEVTLYQKAHPDPAGAGLRHVDYGLSVLRSEVVADLVPDDGPYDLAEVFHQLSLAGMLAGHEVGDRFFEVGSPDGLRDLEAHLARGVERVVPSG
ncbi:MAG: NTP transferase domain-containing protein [Acidimicrobiales bacterium]